MKAAYRPAARPDWLAHSAAGAWLQIVYSVVWGYHPQCRPLVPRTVSGGERSAARHWADRPVGGPRSKTVRTRRSFHGHHPAGLKAKLEQSPLI